MDRRCAMVDCGNPVAGELSSHFYCLEHFLLQCYEQLEFFVSELAERGKGPSTYRGSQSGRRLKLLFGLPLSDYERTS
jgi:hypothetical protein